MAQRQGRGVGSNQYQERVVDVDANERQRARDAIGDTALPRFAETAVSSRPGSTPVSKAVVDHRAAADDHITFATTLPSEASNAEIAARFRHGVQAVSRAEDEVLSRHPNMYGFAVLGANNFLVRAKHDPVLRDAIESGDQRATRVLAACESLLMDAEDEHLDARGISAAIAELEGGGEWSATNVTDESLTQVESEDLEWCREIAGLSVASSRSSGQEQNVLRSRMAEATTTLTNSRLDRLG